MGRGADRLAQAPARGRGWSSSTCATPTWRCRCPPLPRRPRSTPPAPRCARGPASSCGSSPASTPSAARSRCGCRCVRPLGEGELLARVEQLKRTLAGEGLFDADRKKPLPFLPRDRRAGVRAGQRRREGRRRERPAPLAGGRDRAARGRRPGADRRAAGGRGGDRARRARRTSTSSSSPAAAGRRRTCCRSATRRCCGSVAACRTPVVSAIGHEVDTPLLDLVADVRASTPTDAARRVVPDAAAELGSSRRPAPGPEVARRRVERERGLLRRAARPAGPHRPARAVRGAGRRRRGLPGPAARGHRRAASSGGPSSCGATLAHLRALSPCATLERGLRHRPHPAGARAGPGVPATRLTLAGGAARRGRGPRRPAVVGAEAAGRRTGADAAGTDAAAATGPATTTGSTPQPARPTGAVDDRHPPADRHERPTRPPCPTRPPGTSSSTSSGGWSPAARTSRSPSPCGSAARRWPPAASRSSTAPSSAWTPDAARGDGGAAGGAGGPAGWRPDGAGAPRAWRTRRRPGLSPRAPATTASTTVRRSSESDVALTAVVEPGPRRSRRPARTYVYVVSPSPRTWRVHVSPPTSTGSGGPDPPGVGPGEPLLGRRRPPARGRPAAAAGTAPRPATSRPRRLGLLGARVVQPPAVAEPDDVGGRGHVDRGPRRRRARDEQQRRVPSAVAAAPAAATASGRRPAAGRRGRAGARGAAPQRRPRG